MSRLDKLLFVRLRLSVIGVVVLLVGCSGDASNGESNASIGGSSATGNASSGGQTTGVSATSSGLVSTGGTVATVTAAIGGALAAGGTVSTTAANNAGSTAKGGTSSTGGTQAMGGTSSTGGTQATGGVINTGGTTAITVDQTGNPLNGIVSTYTQWLSTVSGDAAKLTADETLADNMITWQMSHGGWFKYGKSKYAAAWNGTDARADWTGANGVELGTIDNGGTVTEMMFLADVYRRNNVTKYRDSARKGMDFILTMQYPSGGFPQVYPARTGTTYSNYATFNDDASVRVLGMLNLAVKQQSPFTATTFSSDQLARIHTAIAKGVDYILKSQIVQSGVKTVWCAQHDPTTYAPKGARSYELPSKSGLESVGVIGFLLSQPQTADVKAAAQAGIAWYKSDAVKVANTAYVNRPSGNTDDTYNPIQVKTGSTLWYRFYDLDKDVGFFSGRLPTDNPPGVGKKYDIMEIEAERRYGYQWGGAYGTKLFAYTDKIGY